MLDAYYELESQFIDLTRITPLENPDETYSPRLYQILQSACGKIENLMRLICNYAELEYRKNKYGDGDFPKYFEPLDQDGMLHCQLVAIEKSNAIFPFILDKNKKTPFWWKEHNETKHKLPYGFKSGNLKNTKFAMAALYSIHCIIYYWNEYGKMILKEENWELENSITSDMYSKFHRHKNDFRPRSNFFYCLNYLHNPI